LAKAIKKISNLIFKHFRISSICQELYFPLRQIKNITSHNADLYICHQESGLFIGNILLKKGYKVAFDFEDFYSEDFLNVYRPIDLLKKTEAFALINAVYVTCPSESMAKSLNQFYDLEKEVSVVYNSFPLKEKFNPYSIKIPRSLLWFSQTVGPGRGIEEIIKALKLVQLAVTITFVGNINETYKEFISGQLSDTIHQIHYIPLLKHYELVDYIKKFQIGLALEHNTPLNKDLTISNKILLCLQANLKVLASKTTGQLDLQESFFDQIQYVELNNIPNFAEIICDIIQSSSNQKTYPFDYRYSWDASEKKIVKLVESALQN
jgi:hypothetical protein